jgi:HK97 family phage major capsid protein
MSIEQIKNAVDELSKAATTRIDGLEDQIRELAQGRDIALDGGRGTGRHPLAAIGDDPGVTALRNGQTKSAIVQLKHSLPSLMIKSTIVGDTPSSENTGYSVQPQRMPGWANDPRRPLSLLDVLNRMEVTSGSFEYNQLDGYTNAADYQAQQGDTKAQADVPTELKTAAIATIAHWVNVSKQVLQDVPMLENAIGDLLRYGVLSKLEREIIVGAGGTGQIAGLTDVGNFTALVTASGDTLADAVAKAQASLNIAGWNAGAVLVHPDTWRLARSERADTGAGVYLAGSWAAPAAPSIWNTPVIQTPHLAVGELIVFDPTQVWLLDRQDAVVEIGRTANQFTQNTMTILAELRAGLAVFAPSAVMYGELTS